ncbi:hypothetical protein Droror1_Dr00003479 [Drosera rotundifolia]
MAFTAILRRSATGTSAIRPLATRLLIGGSKQGPVQSLSTAAADSSSRWFYSFGQRCGRGFASGRTTSADEALLEIIVSEIEAAKETEETAQLEELPPEFPFKIEDNPRQETITLTREYNGETVRVEVSMPDLVTGEREDGDADDEEPAQNSIPLIVSVVKKDGPSLEFSCTAFFDDIDIDSLSLKYPDAPEDAIAYEGPDFSDLDENLQKGFLKYLETRGIKPSVTNFLYEYMIRKDSREYSQWLQDVKKFVSA